MTALLATALLATAITLASTTTPATRRLTTLTSTRGRHPTRTPLALPQPPPPTDSAPAAPASPHHTWPAKAAARDASSTGPATRNASAAPAFTRRTWAAKAAARGDPSAGLPSRNASAAGPDPSPPVPKGVWLASGVTALTCAVLVGGPVGIGVGLVAGVVCRQVLARLEPRSVRAERQRLAADLPAAADLLAACLLSGAPMVDAAEAVAAALGGPVSGPLRSVAAAIRLGADPPGAWRALDARPELAPLSRTVARAMAGGAPLADALTRLADDRRRALRADAAAAARRVGVRAAAPLGLCFLPAFVLIGVTPVVASIAATVVLPLSPERDSRAAATGADHGS